jgi:hypothetical protein
MPELANLRQHSVPLPRYSPQSPVSPVRYADPVPSTEAASSAAAFATLAQALGNLPQAMMDAYDEGKRKRVTDDAQGEISKRLQSGDTSDLAIETGPKGTSVSLNKPDPYGDIKALIARQNLANATAGPNRYNALADRASGRTQPATPPPLPVKQTGPLAAMPELPPVPAGAASAPSGLDAMAPEPPLLNANQDPLSPMITEPTDLSGMGAEPVLDPNTGLIFTTDAAGRKVTVDPTGKIDVIDQNGAKTKDGFTFDSVEAANAYAEQKGFNTPKVSQRNGKLVVDEFTPKETDEKGKIKLTDSAKKELGSAANLIADLKGLETTQEALYNENKAGPVAGRIEQLKAKMGFGDATYVNAAGAIDVGQFKIARLLNGPGVLTDKDINRAQSVAPTLNETPASFKAKMTNVRRMLRESIQTWKTINGGQASADQIALADAGIKSLSEGPTEIAAPLATGNLTAEIDKRQQMLNQGVKADGTPLSPREKAALKMILDRERSKIQ